MTPKKKAPSVGPWDPTKMKPCPECTRAVGRRVDHPQTQEYWYANKSNPDGLDSVCKECRKAKSRTYYTRRQYQQGIRQRIPLGLYSLEDLGPSEPIPSVFKDMPIKRCANLLCGRVRWATEQFFMLDSTREDGLSRSCRRCLTLQGLNETTLHQAADDAGQVSVTAEDAKRLEEDNAGLPGFDEHGLPY